MLTLKVQASGTYSLVYQIFQSSCVASGCHVSGAQAAGLDLSAPPNDVFVSLINTDPQDSIALFSGNKLVKPGYIAQSFLYRIVANRFDSLAILNSMEGDSLHATYLSSPELELIRQWIQYGAPLQDTVVDPQMIADFYNGSGLPMVPAPPTPAQQGLEGLQLRIGPILLFPNQEVEYFHKFFAGLNEEKEIIRLETFFDNQSHHFVIYNFLPGHAARYPEGLQNAGSYAAQIPIHLGATELAAWNIPRDDEMPPGTAYFWDENTAVALDYHVRNYSQTSILAATCYINVYTRERRPNTREMKMEFPIFGGLNPFVLKIPPTGGQPYKQEFTYTKSNEVWEIWKTQGHTHSLGTDFDIFLRNPDGTRGEQIYEGEYDATYSFLQGYFDSEHAPVRTTENPFIEVDMNNGIILEATWVNNSSDTIPFGLTTEDEMFAAYINYTVKQASTGILGHDSKSSGITVIPNPATDQFRVSTDGGIGEIATINLYDSAGKLLLSSVFEGIETTVPVEKLSPGLYTLVLSGDRGTRRHTVVLQ